MAASPAAIRWLVTGANRGIGEFIVFALVLSKCSKVPLVPSLA
jgi:hypothetical protein